MMTPITEATPSQIAAHAKRKARLDRMPLKCTPTIAAFAPDRPEYAPLPLAPMARILNETCQKYGLSKYDMLSAPNSIEVRPPRREAMWRMENEIGKRLTDIGLFFGKSTSTIKRGINRHQSRIDAGLAV